MAKMPSQKETLEAMLVELQGMSAAIAANSAAVSGLAADLSILKNFTQWELESHYGGDAEIDGIASGGPVP